MRQKLEEEVKRFSRFQKAVFGAEPKGQADTGEVDVRTYAKYLLKEGSIIEKRELLANLKSKIIYQDRKIKLV